jgi:hypothetical protein
MILARRFLPIAVLTASLVFLPAKADDLDRYFAANNPNATMTVDHSAWERLLSTYVVVSNDKINRFAYGRVTAADKKALKAYLTALQGVKVTALEADEQRAFWINLYNALTIDVVLDHYPVKSIKDISLGGGFFATGPWKKQLVTVEGKALSLDNIERDARVHYAVNCASMSCPNLMAKAFTGANLERMLNQGARDYVNHPRGVKVDAGRAKLSQIYSWYRSDFGKNDAEVLAHVGGYAEAALKKRLAGIKTIAGYDYDWSLNEAK